MYHLKMDKQMNNIKSVKAQMLPELYDDDKRSPLLPKEQANNQANNRLTRHRSMPTPGNKNPRHQLPRSSNATMIHLVPTDYVRETSSGTSSTTYSKFTTRHKPTWEPLLPL
jgi:hypothetical protein